MRGRRAAAVAGLTAAALAGSACQGALDPKSDQAASIANLWWWMLGISVAVAVVVLALLGYALVRRRNGPSIFERRSGFAPIAIFVTGAAIPLAILLVVFAYSVVIVRDSGEAHAGALNVRITAHQWWYDVEYPDSGASERDQLHLEAHRQARIELVSADVIHSFWVPELNGKVDFVPGHNNVIYITDPEPGSYDGHCAEFCGIGHATMAIAVTVQPEAEFQAWLAAASTEARR